MLLKDNIQRLVNISFTKMQNFCMGHCFSLLLTLSGFAPLSHFFMPEAGFLRPQLLKLIVETYLVEHICTSWLWLWRPLECNISSAEFLHLKDVLSDLANTVSLIPKMAQLNKNVLDCNDSRVLWIIYIFTERRRESEEFLGGYRKIPCSTQVWKNAF